MPGKLKVQITVPLLGESVARHVKKSHISYLIDFFLSRPSLYTVFPPVRPAHTSRLRLKWKASRLKALTNLKHFIHVHFLRNRKHLLCFYRVIETRVEVWENEKCCGNTSRRRVFLQLDRNTENMFYIYFRKHRDKKTKTTC